MTSSASTLARTTEAAPLHRLGMLLRAWLLGLSVVGLSLLAGLNWTALNTVLPVNLVLAQMQLPIGWLVLGLAAALWLVSLLCLSLLRSPHRPDGARLLKELRQLGAHQAQAHSDQCAQTEALRQALSRELQPMKAELARLQQVPRLSA